MQTPDLTEGNITKIKELFPNVITEKEGADGVVEKCADQVLLDVDDGGFGQGDDFGDFQ